MSGKNAIVKVVLLFCFSILFACSGLQKPPIVKNYFDLDIHIANTKNHRQIRQNNILLVKELSIASEFDSHSFVYRVDKNKYINDFYNEFISYPAKLISEKISETLYASEYFTPFSNQKQQDISFRLSGKITHLYGDMQKKNSPEAIMEIRFVLEKKTDNTFKKIFAQTYKARKILSSRKPEHLIIGWSKGLETITSNFLDDLAQQGLIKKK